MVTQLSMTAQLSMVMQLELISWKQRCGAVARQPTGPAGTARQANGYITQHGHSSMPAGAHQEVRCEAQAHAKG